MFGTVSETLTSSASPNVLLPETISWNVVGRVGSIPAVLIVPMFTAWLKVTTTERACILTFSIWSAPTAAGVDPTYTLAFTTPSPAEPPHQSLPWEAVTVGVALAA